MKELKISAIKEGTVIDHIPSNKTFDIVKILNLDKHNDIISVASNLPSKKTGSKGLIKIGGKGMTKKEVNKIAVIAKNATVSTIKDFQVVKKEQVEVPDEVTNIIKCSNPNCITHKEKVKTIFSIISKEPLKVRCHYCERIMHEKDIEVL